MLREFKIMVLLLPQRVLNYHFFLAFTGNLRVLCDTLVDAIGKRYSICGTGWFSIFMCKHSLFIFELCWFFFISIIGILLEFLKMTAEKTCKGKIDFSEVFLFVFFFFFFFFCSFKFVFFLVFFFLYFFYFFFFLSHPHVLTLGLQLR